MTARHCCCAWLLCTRKFVNLYNKAFGCHQPPTLCCQAKLHAHMSSADRREGTHFKGAPTPQSTVNLDMHLISEANTYCFITNMLPHRFAHYAPKALPRMVPSHCPHEFAGLWSLDEAGQ